MNTGCAGADLPPSPSTAPARPVSQKDLILEHLRSGRSLTVAQALTQFGIYALSQRVGELKRAGYPITSELIEVKDGCRVAQYRLGDSSSAGQTTGA